MNDADASAVRRRFCNYILKSAPAYMQPILCVARDFDICLPVLLPQSPILFSHDGQYIATISDDLNFAAGPKSFMPDALERIIANCALAVVVSVKFEQTPYDLAARVAIGSKVNIAIIETEMCRDLEWARAIQEINPKIVIEFCTFIAQGSA